MHVWLQVVTVFFVVVWVAERSWVLGGGKGHAQLQQLGESLGKIGAELVLVVLVLHHILLESTIPEEAHVGREHHPATRVDERTGASEILQTYETMEIQ
jgi:hypothetical protein